VVRAYQLHRAYESTLLSTSSSADRRRVPCVRRCPLCRCRSLASPRKRRPSNPPSDETQSSRRTRLAHSNEASDQACANDTHHRQAATRRDKVYACIHSAVDVRAGPCGGVCDHNQSARSSCLKHAVKTPTDVHNHSLHVCLFILSTALLTARTCVHPGSGRELTEPNRCGRRMYASKCGLSRRLPALSAR
jgi:hypothetical protein